METKSKSQLSSTGPLFKKSQLTASEFIAAITSKDIQYELKYLPIDVDGEKYQYAMARLSHNEVNQAKRNAKSLIRSSKEQLSEEEIADKEYVSILAEAIREYPDVSKKLFNPIQLEKLFTTAQIIKLWQEYQNTMINLGGSIIYLTEDELSKFIKDIIDDPDLDLTGFLESLTLLSAKQVISKLTLEIVKLKSGITCLSELLENTKDNMTKELSDELIKRKNEVMKALENSQSSDQIQEN